jgi:hypothetical protein
MKIIRPMTVDDAALLSSNVPEDDYAAYNGATVYATGDRALYITGDIHWIIESLQDGNVGNIPTGEATDTYWLLVGNNNRWKMFDTSITSQTQNADTIDVSILGDGRIDSVALLNVNAASVNVIMTDSIDGEVYNETYSLVADSGINDWYAYFFEPIIRLSDFSITDMPPYANATIDVVLSDTGNTVYCGGLVLGLSANIGQTQYGLGLGITDYSVKTQDAFGNYTILERAFRKTADATLFVDNTFVDQLQTMLASYRSTPIVWLGTDSFGASIIYGFYKEFFININYPESSLCTISIEGLT